VHSIDIEPAWELPKGAKSVAITRSDERFYVHFLEVGKVVIPLRWIEHWMKKKPGYFECIYDPTRPVEPTLDSLPLFQETA
jgi:hypothetical protein